MLEANKILIVYFTRTGHTKKVAETLSSMLNSDLVQIKDHKNYNGVMGFIKAGYLAYFKKESSIENLEIDTNDYELLILCSPNWAGSIAPGIRTFSNQYELPQTAWIITCGDLNANVAHLPTPDSNIRTIIKIKDKDIAGNNFEDSLKEFIAML